MSAEEQPPWITNQEAELVGVPDELDAARDKIREAIYDKLPSDIRPPAILFHHGATSHLITIITSRVLTTGERDIIHAVVPDGYFAQFHSDL